MYIKLKFDQGATRRVVLVGNYAIKISKFGISHLLNVSVRALFYRGWLKKRISECGDEKRPYNTVFRQIFLILTQGIKANRQEYRLSKKYPELPFAPVYATLFFGIIIIMKRGTPVPECRSKEFMQKNLKRGLSADLDIPKHVCSLDGRLAYIDYGHPDIIEALGLDLAVI